MGAVTTYPPSFACRSSSPVRASKAYGLHRTAIDFGERPIVRVRSYRGAAAPLSPGKPSNNTMARLRLQPLMQLGQGV
jgi:hypothetical protein